jgi:excinuclease ABC subunit A
VKRAIKIVGANTHNLKGITCVFPRRKISVVTGVSGSGKSSLVFDTLYAEGQRRYVQSLSTYARLFLEQMERPDVESISDIPPAIALEQKNSIKNARSTVGTITEIHDYLRLLMTHAGTLTCTSCASMVEADTVESATAEVMALPEGIRVAFHTSIPLHGTDLDAGLDALTRQGYTRLWVKGEAKAIDDLRNSKFKGDELDVVIDRFALSEDKRTRINEAIERGFHLGGGRVTLSELDAKRPDCVFDERFTCRKCDREYPRPSPHLFSFNSPLGACSECEGFGRVVDIDIDKVIPNKRLSLRDGAVAPWSTPAYSEFQSDFLAAAERHSYSTELPYSQLSDEAKQWILAGDRESPGIVGFFEWLEARRYKTHVRILLARYRSYRTCRICKAARLKPEALAVRIGRRNIADFCALSVADLAKAISRLKLTADEKERASSVLAEIKNRLNYLLDVGLGYLTLDRQARTLSGGEAQRIHLAAALGSSLTDTLYALDEPTLGLHPRDS